MPGFLLFAFIGPETILPVTSVLAAAVGFVLGFGGSVTRPVVGGVRWLFGKKTFEPKTHLPVSDMSAESHITRA